MQIFKIFYSWQSDLPGNKTRYLLQESIDEAIDLAQDAESFEAKRDESTTDTTGSPNIVSTLFSKIDDCDLFIADISLCFSETSESKKKSPNPNVLLELGYAAKTLGWERILCFCNTDFGNEYPFDIAQNRITNYSLDGHTRKEVKNELAKIIFSNIRDIRKNPPRAKTGMASHIIGSYDFDNHTVINHLLPIEICQQESYILHNQELLLDAKKLIKEIYDLTDRINSVSSVGDSDGVSNNSLEPIHTLSNNLYLSSGLPFIAESFKGQNTPVSIENIPEEKERIRRWLNIDVPEEFFKLDGLSKYRVLFNNHEEVFHGPIDVKTKYNKLQSLSYILFLLDVRTNYPKTFEGMRFIPLAINNFSSLYDTNIRIVVYVEEGEIVEPDEHLIWADYDGMQRYICRDDNDETDVGLICELFYLPEDGVIHIEDDQFDSSRQFLKSPILTENGFSYPQKTEEDYKQELENFIASSNGSRYFEFEISSLRPGECKWLPYGILVKPVMGKIILRYQIYSSHSSGDLTGILKYETD